MRSAWARLFLSGVVSLRCTPGPAVQTQPSGSIPDNLARARTPAEEPTRQNQIGANFANTSGNKSPAIIASGSVAVTYGSEALPSVPTCNELSIDDVIVTKKAAGVQLDVRVRNRSPLTVNITRASVHILNRRPAPSVYKPSAEYQLLITGNDNDVVVSHALRPNEVDNFLLVLGFTPFNSACSFEARLALMYNGSCSASSPSLSFDSNF